jgi:xanthine dehydrogenase accessory factor
MPSSGATQRLAFSASGEPMVSVEDVSGVAHLRDQSRASCRSGRAQLVDEPVRAFIDPILPHPRAIIFGGGHVAVPVALMADLVGFRVVVVDDREEFANRERFPRAHEVVVASVLDAFEKLSIDDDSYVVTVTRGHAMDEDVVAEALRTPARYIGMIGSRRKVAAVLARLRGRRFSEDDLARVHAPIGIDIDSETVEEIAVSIVAELIAVRRRES